MFGSCVFFFVLAIIYELLKFYRHWLANRTYSRAVTVNANEENGASTISGTSGNSTGGDKIDRPLHCRDQPPIIRPAIGLLSVQHIMQTVLHMIQIFISYILMLAVMYYNVWLILAIILGAGVGYFAVGFRQYRTYSDFGDHCH